MHITLRNSGGWCLKVGWLSLIHPGVLHNRGNVLWLEGAGKGVTRVFAFFVARIVIARVRELVIARISRLFHA